MSKPASVATNVRRFNVTYAKPIKQRKYMDGTLVFNPDNKKVTLRDFNGTVLDRWVKLGLKLNSCPALWRLVEKLHLNGGLSQLMKKFLQQHHNPLCPLLPPLLRAVQPNLCLPYQHSFLKFPLCIKFLLKHHFALTKLPPQ
ncbi:hypothetical protein Pelo_19256 [Pelomyxa schiedti]|nr:hypothetical protein Pelo_19256 [Pelomyxa schiedti]